MLEKKHLNWPKRKRILQDFWKRSPSCWCTFHDRRRSPTLNTVEFQVQDLLLTRNVQYHARLPNTLCLQKQKVERLESHGLGISSRFGSEPMFVGYRDGSRRKKKINSMELCQGYLWYGRRAGPFLKASQTAEDRINIQFRSYLPDHHGKRSMTVVKANGKWSFIMDIPRPGDDAMMPEAFEWRHNQKYRVSSSEKLREGYVLVQLSTQQAVARMSVSGSILSSDIEIEYLGAGQVYGGLWKIISLVVGTFGTSDL